VNSDRLLCAVAADQFARDVIDTGNALAAATGLEPVFASIAEVDVAASSSVIPVGAGAGWAPFPEGGFYAAEQRAAERAADFLSDLGVDTGDAHISTGNPTAALDGLAHDLDACAIVVGGPRAAGARPLSMGRVPRWLTVNGTSPVAFARPDPDLTGSGPVICGVDPDSESAVGVAGVAGRFAWLMDRALVLIHVADGDHTDDRSRRLDEIAASLGAAGLGVEVTVERGDEAERLIAQADRRSASLIVVGNRGRGPIRAALTGSVSLDLVNEAAPVVVVVPPASRIPRRGRFR
jgi:nucleotide-binding universal stress UspA family protein